MGQTLRRIPAEPQESLSWLPARWSDPCLTVIVHHKTHPDRAARHPPALQGLPSHSQIVGESVVLAGSTCSQCPIGGGGHGVVLSQEALSTQHPGALSIKGRRAIGAQQSFFLPELF